MSGSWGLAAVGATTIGFAAQRRKRTLKEHSHSDGCFILSMRCLFVEAQGWHRRM